MVKKTFLESEEIMHTSWVVNFIYQGTHVGQWDEMVGLTIDGSRQRIWGIERPKKFICVHGIEFQVMLS